MKRIAGVDTHRDTHSIAIIDELGVMLDAFTIAASAEGYAEAMERTASMDDLVWGLEGTGSYGRRFADALIAENCTVYEVPGTITKRHRRRLRQRGKSDPQDAHAIAEAVLREGETLPRHLVADQEEAVRLLYDRRDRVVRDQTVKINRIRALALRLGLPRSGDLTHKASLEQLETALDERAPQGFAEFEVADETRELIADLRQIHSRLADMEKRLRPFVETLAPGLLEVRGCSVISAAGLIGHTGSVSNYRSDDAFAAHAGVAPIPCSSGQYRSVRVNTGGNRQLNRCLHNLANTQLRTPNHIGKAYYDRKRSEGKTHREAMRCLKRSLARVVFHILRDAVNIRATGGSLVAAA